MSRGDLPVSLGEVLGLAVEILAQGRSYISPRAEAELIVQHFLEIHLSRLVSRSQLMLSLQEVVSQSFKNDVLAVANARKSGKILQHLLGYQHFLGHRYHVSPEVLVPRPETEILVSELVKVLLAQPNPPQQGVEIGLGSGIISIELLCQFEKLLMVSSEASSSAIEIANKNARHILGKDHAARLKILESSNSLELWEPFVNQGYGKQFDFIVSNPPYLVEENLIEEDVKSQEPALALYSPKIDDFYFYRGIARDGFKFLKDHGILTVEIPHQTSREIEKLFCDFGWSVMMVKDLNQRERVLIARRPV